jgi:Cd2+/Zn2+-exporting ATPase
MATTHRDKVITEKLTLSGMDCADCAMTIEKSLGGMQGVSSAEVNFGTGTARVSYDPARVSRDQIDRQIAALGYRVEDNGARAASDSRALEFNIEGMDCADCAVTVEKAVSSLQGVDSANVSFGTGRLVVVPAKDDSALAGRVEHIVREAGYRAIPAQARSVLAQEPFWKRERRVLTTAIGTLFALAAFALSFTGAPALLVNGLYAAAMVVGGLGFARAGLLALRSGRADMNLLMTIAVIGAAAIGDWGEGATVVLLFAFGGTLQAYTLEKTRSSIRSLMDLTPTTAMVRREQDGETREFRVPVDEVVAGETVLVGPGERVPLDGVVLWGASSVDQSPITGESVPVDVAEGADVYAGTINGPGALGIRVTHPASDTTLARIIDMVEDAQARRAPSQQLVDRFSAVYTPLVIAGAALIAVVPPLFFAQPFNEWFYRALVLLVVSCPCALVISTPVSIVAAIGAATRRGVLIKGGATLETLGAVRAVAFDKTGTLTEGRPQVVGVYAQDGDTVRVLRLAAAAEQRSEHPLARAVVHAARNGNGSGNGLPPALDFTALPGMGARATVDGREVYVGNSRLFADQGIALDGLRDRVNALHAEGKTAVLVGTREGALGVIALADSPRNDARAAVADLHAAGVGQVVMLTGDNARTAQAVASSLGVDSYRAELLPAQKVDAVRDLREQFGTVAMVGDGVNDAPALATANVGIAMGIAGTDAALEVADVALMSDDLSKLDYAVRLSRRTVSVIKQNIGVSLAVKAIALVLAAFGALPLWGAIFADMGVSLLVTLNGMTLLGYKGKGRD